MHMYMYNIAIETKVVFAFLLFCFFAFIVMPCSKKCNVNQI